MLNYKRSILVLFTPIRSLGNKSYLYQTPFHQFLIPSIGKIHYNTLQHMNLHNPIFNNCFPLSNMVLKLPPSIVFTIDIQTKRDRRFTHPVIFILNVKAGALPSQLV